MELTRGRASLREDVRRSVTGGFSPLPLLGAQLAFLGDVGGSHCRQELTSSGGLEVWCQ